MTQQQIDRPCARCGHSWNEHTTESALGVIDSNRSVCLECNGWYEDGRIGRKVLHRFKENNDPTTD